jgi:signal transduction histidine kinase
MAYQIGALVLLSLIVFGAITGLIIRTQYAESLRNDLAVKGESVARGIAVSVQRQSLEGSAGRINDLIDQLSRIHGVAYIAVVDAEGRVLARGHEGAPLPDSFAPRSRGRAGAGAISSSTEEVMDVAVTVEIPPVASVHVGMDLGSVERSLETVVPLVVWRIVLVSIVCAMSVAVIVYFRVIRPIRRITDSVRELGPGRGPARGTIRAGGELGVLAHSLQQMTDEAVRYHDQLESKTRELQISKEELQRQHDELKRAQAQMIRSEKFASMGQLAASVAHEISNPLAGILTYLKLIRRKLEGGQLRPEQQETYRQYLLSMERETERCGNIVKNLLDFARSSEPDLRDLEIRRVIDDTLFLLNYTLIKSDVLVTKAYEEVPKVLGDFGQLKQVFLNVILNAVEAMKGEERVLTIHTHHHRESQTVLVEIQDTGEGISEQNIYRVFDPFFTTKPRGTGMGLAVVYGILEKHNADISIDSQPQKGTKVTVQLNVAHPEDPGGPDQSSSEA